MSCKRFNRLLRYEEHHEDRHNLWNGKTKSGFFLHCIKRHPKSCFIWKLLLPLQYEKKDKNIRWLLRGVYGRA